MNDLPHHDHEGHEHHHDHASGHGAHATGDKPFTDPVCGMKVCADPAREIQYEGQAYHFCSTKCMDKFHAAPQQYVGGAKPEPATPAAEGTIYTCPMHPEIREPQPGNCPICGMALEPMMPSLEEEANPELVDFKRRFLWTLPLTVIVTVLAMAGHRLFKTGLPGKSWIEFVLSTPVVLWAGWPFQFRLSVAHIVKGQFPFHGVGIGYLEYDPVSGAFRCGAGRSSRCGCTYRAACGQGQGLGKD